MSKSKNKLREKLEELDRTANRYFTRIDSPGHKRGSVNDSLVYSMIKSVVISADRGATAEEIADTFRPHYPDLQKKDSQTTETDY